MQEEGDMIRGLTGAEGLKRITSGLALRGHTAADRQLQNL